MKLLKGISLFASAVLFLSSCGGGGASLASNELVKQLPDDQKAAIVKMVDGQCKCVSNMKGDIGAVKTAVEAYSKKVDEYVAAIESKDLEKAKAADKAVSEAQDAVSTAQKAVRDANPEQKDCQKKLMESFSEDEQKAMAEANKKLESLAKEKYGEEADKKLGELALSSCPGMKAGSEIQEIGSAARKKYSENMSKMMDMEMNSMMDSAPATDSTATPEG